MSILRNMRKTLGFSISHPLNRNRRLATVWNYFKWQITARLTPGPVIVRFVDETSIIVQPPGHSTLIIHTGLYDFEDMLFLLHFLRDDDLFADIGANIGIYSILSAGAAKANTIAFEPIPSTYKSLCRNIHLNALENRITPLNMALGSSKGKLSFTAGEGAQNHVIGKHDTVSSKDIDVNVEILDEVLKDQVPTAIKIDVEGFETEVFNGGKNTLENKELQVIIMELNGSGERYGYDENQLHKMIIDHGFGTYTYDPINRSLTSLGGKINKSSTNTLYLRNKEFCTTRIKNSKKYKIVSYDKSF